MSGAAVARSLATKKVRLFHVAISAACFIFMLTCASSAGSDGDVYPEQNSSTIGNVDDDEPTTPLPTATPLGSPGSGSGDKFYYEYTRPAGPGESFLKSSRKHRMEDETFTRQYNVGSDGADGMVFATGSCALQVHLYLPFLPFTQKSHVIS